MALKQKLNENNNNTNSNFFQHKLNYQNIERNSKSSSRTSLNTLENFSKYVEILPQTSRRRFVTSDRVTLRKLSPVQLSTAAPLNINNNYKIVSDNFKKVSILNNTTKDDLKQKKQVFVLNKNVLNANTELSPTFDYTNENLSPINSKDENNEKNLRRNSVSSFTS